MMTPDFFQSHRESCVSRGLREHLEWLLTNPDIGLIPVDPITKSPLLPCSGERDDTDGFVCVHDDRHGPCRRFNRAAQSATRNVDSLMNVLRLHPALFVAVVPRNDMLIIDFDAPSALDAFLSVTGVRLDGNLVVETRRGVHLYLRADLAKHHFRTHQSIDVRHSGNGLVVAPGGRRADGGRYLIANGDWTNPARATAPTLSYFAAPPTAIAARAQPRVGLSASAKARRATSRIELMLARRANHDPVYSDNREDTSASADLCSMWLHGYHSGLDPAEIVELVADLNPSAVRSRLATRSVKWLREDAERVYGKADNGKGRRRFLANMTRSIVTDRFGEQHPATGVFDFFVDKVNRIQKRHINVGVEELGDELSVSKCTAGRYIRMLLDAGVLRVVRKHFFSVTNPEQNKTRQFEVAWLADENPGAKVRIRDEQGFTMCEPAAPHADLAAGSSSMVADQLTLRRRRRRTA